MTIDGAMRGTGDEILSERLLRLRRECGLSRAALSRRTGFSKPSIWAWETGKTIPRRASLIVLADAFGLSERELLTGNALVADDTAPTAKQIRALVQSSREGIAALAGVEPRKVKIMIEF